MKCMCMEYNKTAWCKKSFHFCTALWIYTMHLLRTVIASFLLGWTLRTAQFTCQSAVGGYRDCTCGVQYRDVEKRCCSVRTCLQPVVFTENMTCPFQCLSNGTYIAEDHLCQCTEGRYGLCCEKGTRLHVQLM